MFVLARFLAHWTTAIVLNSVLPLIEHSHFIALTQKIKFLSKGAPLISLWRIKRNGGSGGKIKTWRAVVMWKENECAICEQGENILAAVRRMKAALCDRIRDGSLYSQPDSVVKILVGCSKMFSWLQFGDAVCTYHLLRLRLKQPSFPSSEVSSLWPYHLIQSIPMHCVSPKFIELL